MCQKCKNTKEILLIVFEMKQNNLLHNIFDVIAEFLTYEVQCLGIKIKIW